MDREFKISERQLNDILESISRIDRQVEMIKKGNTEVKKTGVKRLDIILDKTLLVNAICTEFQTYQVLACDNISTKLYTRNE